MISVKCVVIGDKSVGKTSILSAYTNNFFPTGEDLTHQDFQYFTNTIVDGRPYHFDLWDTIYTGNETYDRLRPLCYPGTAVFLVCFSTISPPTFESVSTKWIKELKRHAPKVPIILVGTKIDTRDDTEVLDCLKEKGVVPITYQQGLAKLKEIRAHKYMECSALTQEGLKNVFDEAVRSVVHPPIKKNTCIII
ncbi:hypothetical protein PPL_00739 [Heterostelium album PN500]|uniref:Rho GTPase n=1 Tax=Heterostelium pallidum (strain ATCC 26659 / Pp 5 / PN500) TaxID=670386 RepID=D3AXA8_HETP5|nr:hypothetical protein PPL_00739 [Heterostelium album PN500]EFA86177.1 hypothetical protein PPL_00739 [Heterostelium album PN500]|eukprot:XP_020438282.1 hypothetical protein PPL_00739 [Heterostelium album PN500]